MLSQVRKGTVTNGDRPRMEHTVGPLTDIKSPTTIIHWHVSNETSASKKTKGCRVVLNSLTKIPTPLMLVAHTFPYCSCF